MLNGVVPDEDDGDVLRPPTWGMLVARCPPPLARSRTPSHGSGNHLPGRARSRRPGGGHGRGGGAAVAVKKSATWPYRARLAGLRARAANVVSCVMRTEQRGAPLAAARPTSAPPGTFHAQGEGGGGRARGQGAGAGILSCLVRPAGHACRRPQAAQAAHPRRHKRHGRGPRWRPRRRPRRTARTTTAVTAPPRSPRGTHGPRDPSLP